MPQQMITHLVLRGLSLITTRENYHKMFMMMFPPEHLEKMKDEKTYSSGYTKNGVYTKFCGNAHTLYGVINENMNTLHTCKTMSIWA